jgi:hypothetical protein
MIMADGNHSVRANAQPHGGFTAKYPGVDLVHYATLTKAEGFARDHRVIVYQATEVLLRRLGLVQESELPLGGRRTRGSGCAPNLWLVTREKGKQLRVWREVSSDNAASEIDEVRAW